MRRWGGDGTDVEAKLPLATTWDMIRQCVHTDDEDREDEWDLAIAPVNSQWPDPCGILENSVDS
jgi:hypothetical protein